VHGRRVNYLGGIGILKGLFDVTVNYQRARCGVNSQTFPSERRGRNNGVASCNHTLGRPSDRCALALIGTDPRCIALSQWECRFDVDHVIPLDHLIAVSRVRPLWVESGRLTHVPELFVTAHDTENPR